MIAHTVRLAASVAMVALLGLTAAAGVGGLYSGGSGSSGNELVAAPDWVAPTVSSSVIGKSQGGVPGFIRQGGSYSVYANVGDSGNPASGVVGVVGDLSTTSGGQTAAALSSGAFAIGGSTYNHRGAALTANAVLPAGTYSYSLTSSDAAVPVNRRVQSGYTVVVDNTAPAAGDIQTSNKSGNVAGRAEIGDTIVYAFSEPIDAGSILSGWTGSATGVVARITNATNDPLTIFNATNAAELPLGSVRLGRNDYVSASATFGATGTASTMTQSGSSITITLGTASTGPTTGSASSTMVWSPSAAAYDRAGNAQDTATRSEGGASDREF